MNLVLLAAVVVGSALVSWAAVAASIRLSHHFGLHDHPDGHRKLQERPIPKLGGLAVAGAFSTSALILLAFMHPPDAVTLGLAVLLPALAGALVGYIDDLKHIQPVLRLLLQAGIAGLAWLLGTRIEISGFEPLDLILTILWFMVVINGINLLDNSDGLAGTTVLVSAAGATIVALLLGQELVSLLAIALVGVCLGYLWHNWHPARVYMGDSGAYFLGVLLATVIIRLRPEALSPGLGAAIALLLVALPLLDTAYVVIKRLRSGIHPFTAGRDHLSHVLQDRGRSVPASVVLLQTLLVATSLVAIGITWGASAVG